MASLRRIQHPILTSQTCEEQEEPSADSSCKVGPSSSYLDCRSRSRAGVGTYPQLAARKSSTSTCASRRIARSVPSAMSLGVTRHGNLSTSPCVTPDLMAPRSWDGRTCKPNRRRRRTTSRYLKPPHYGTLTGTSKSTPTCFSPRDTKARGSGSPCSMHDSAIWRASPCAISVAFRDAAPFRHQARHIRARGEKTHPHPTAQYAIV